jgi:hypothetical protein
MRRLRQNVQSSGEQTDTAMLRQAHEKGWRTGVGRNQWRLSIMPRYTLETIVLVLLLLWLLGWLVMPGIGSLVHLLLVVILVVIVIRLFQGRTPLP